MDTKIDMTYIMVPELPIEVDLGEWILNPPDCDTVLDDIQGSSHSLVYAYATNEDGNDELHRYRDKNLPGMEILKGVSSYGIRKLL